MYVCQGADFCTENKSDDNGTWAIIMIDGVWDHRRLRSLPWPLDSRRVVDWCGCNVAHSASREGAPSLLRTTPTLGLGKNATPGTRYGICAVLSWHASLPLYNRSFPGTEQFLKNTEICHVTWWLDYWVQNQKKGKPGLGDTLARPYP